MESCHADTAGTAAAAEASWGEALENVSCCAYLTIDFLWMMPHDDDAMTDRDAISRVIAIFRFPPAYDGPRACDHEKSYCTRTAVREKSYDFT